MFYKVLLFCIFPLLLINCNFEATSQNNSEIELFCDMKNSILVQNAELKIKAKVKNISNIPINYYPYRSIAYLEKKVISNPDGTGIIFDPEFKKCFILVKHVNGKMQKIRYSSEITEIIQGRETIEVTYSLEIPAQYPKGPCKLYIEFVTEKEKIVLPINVEIN